MSRKKTIIRVFAILIAITVIATIVAYFIIQPDKPWMALFIAGMGGLIAVNLSITLYFLNKNLKN